MSTASFPSTILLVDDEELVIDLLSRVFKRAGLPFVAVTTGQEALSLLERERFGALVSDKNLPDVDGVEVLRAARRLQPFCACIMLTGYSTTESVLEVLRMGASDYIEKPFPDVKLLVQRIQTAMAHQRAEFERSTLVDAVRAMQRSLEEKSARAFQLQTEREMLESVLELKVEEQTEALRKRVELLDADARANRELDRMLLQHLESLQEYLRGISVDGGTTPTMVRGMLREIGRRVEHGAGLLRERLEPPPAPLSSREEAG